MQKLKKKSLSKKQLILIICSACLVVAAVVGVVAYQLSIPTYFYTIIDQKRIKHVESESQDVAVVLQEAQAFLGEHDRYSVEETDEGTKITIERAQCVTVVVKDQIKTFYTMGGTVEDLLKEHKIGRQDPWRVDVDLTTKTRDGMTIHVDFVETRSDSVERPLAYKTLYCEDPSMEEGQTELLFEGVNGVQETITTRTYVNGVMESMTVAENVEVVAATPQIVAVGTGEKVGQGRQFPLFGDKVIITKEGKPLYYSHMDIFEATGYTAWIDDVTGTTACGTPARVGAVAVDPTVIPYFTKMYIVSEDGVYDYGEASAEDCGGVIKGKIIDLFFDTEGECWQFGRRDIKVYFLTDKPA